MSSREFAEWIAYTRHEPVGPARLDMLAALQMALFANANRDAKKRPEPYTADEFIPRWWPDPDAETTEPEQPGRDPQEIWAAIKTWAMLSGARKIQ